MTSLQNNVINSPVYPKLKHQALDTHLSLQSIVAAGLNQLHSLDVCILMVYSACESNYCSYTHRAKIEVLLRLDALRQSCRLEMCVWANLGSFWLVRQLVEKSLIDKWVRRARSKKRLPWVGNSVHFYTTVPKMLQLHIVKLWFARLWWREKAAYKEWLIHFF